MLRLICFLSCSCVFISIQAQEFSEFEPILFTTAGASDVVLADLNGDGFLDYVVAARAEMELSWFPNDGNGGFESQLVISDSCFNVQTLAVGDIDQDGDNDVVANTTWHDGYYPGVLSFLNDGTGETWNETVLSEDILIATKLLLVDVDSDQDLDLFAADWGTQSINLYTNNGSGQFDFESELADDFDNPSNMEFEDLDGDGVKDLVFSGENADGIMICYGQGSGVYGEPEEVLFQVRSVKAFDVGDVDGDGDLDILFASLWFSGNTSYPDLDWLENDGSGTFMVAHDIQMDLENGDYLLISDLELLDLDEDGDLDMMSTSGGLYPYFYLNDGSGDFGEFMELDNGVESVQAFGTGAIDIGDIDLDGHLDFVFAQRSKGQVYFHLNQGDLSFGDFTRISPEVMSPRTVRASDINGDGLEDLVCRSNVQGQIFWQENLGGEFSSRNVLDTLYAPTYEAYFEVEDMDGDGDPDVIVSNRDAHEYTWYENLGNEEFAQGEQLIQYISPYRVVISDIDSDGDQDVISVDYDGLRFFENINMEFETHYIFDLGYGRSSILVEDIDGDSDRDLVILGAGEENEECFALFNNGSAEFSDPQPIISGASFMSVDNQPGELADLDGDGDMDLLLSAFNQLIALINDGSGNFDEGITIATNPDGRFAGEMELSDFDNDGDLDIIIVEQAGFLIDEDIVYLKNLGDMVFQTSFEFRSEDLIPRIWLENGVEGVGDLTSLDVDGDGDDDVLFAYANHNQLIWADNLLGEGCTEPSACNYDPNATIDSGNCCYDDCGCTDEDADNYNPDASCEDGSCQYTPGCTNINADNYNPDASADDGSCEFEINGLVYNDANENGNQEDSESGIGGYTVRFYDFYDVFIGMSVTNNSGEFTYTAPSGMYTVRPDSASLFPFATTDPALSIFLGGTSQELSFGRSNEEPLYDISAQASSDTYLCNAPVPHDIFISNLSNDTIHGTVELEMDSLFQGFEEISPIDSANGNHVWMSFEDLGPGASINYQIVLLTPSPEYIGEQLMTSYRIWGLNGADTVAYGQDMQDRTLTCAFDPNDKRVDPPGYSDDHFVQIDSLLEYHIRFQNVGNAPAINVRVQDVIDDKLDISTLELKGHSHAMSMSTDLQTRVVDFYFDNILLPDSGSNEPESHGYVTFSILPQADVELLDEINNTAEIFFDFNEPIITNTTWSTMYDCSLFEASFVADGPVLTASPGDTYQWFLDEEAIEGANEQVYIAGATGLYSVQVFTEFPCVSESGQTLVIVSSQDEFSADMIQLSPNPMPDYSQLYVGELRGEVQVEIIDVRGALVRSETFEIHSEQIRLAKGELTSGQYLLRLTSSVGVHQLILSVE